MPIVGAGSLPTPATFVLPPDIELVVCDYLREVLLGSAEVGLTVPGDEEIRTRLPFVRVSRSGGVGKVSERLDFPRVDIDVWHADNSKVNTYGRQVRGALSAMTFYYHRGQRLTITRSAEVVGPQRLPDEDPDIKRLGFTVELTVRQS